MEGRDKLEGEKKDRREIVRKGRNEMREGRNEEDGRKSKD